MATFILVHGTFAKSAHWPNLQSGLEETTRAAGDEPVVEPVRWTGRNSASAREAAASAIFTSVQKIRRISAKEKIFVIGHSHGGSAIAYFLKEHPEVAKTLAGCAFLSTPFVAIRARKEAVRHIWALILFPYIAVLGVWNEWSKVRKPLSSYPLEEVLPLEAYLLPILVTAVFMAVAFLFALMVQKAKAPHRAEQAIRQQTADIPAGHYLFLRCSGDEAAAALSFTQFIAWLAMKTFKMLEIVTRPYADIYNAGTDVKDYGMAAVRGALLAVFHLALLTVLGYALVYVLPGICKFGISEYFSQINTGLYAVVLFVVACLLLLCLLAVVLIFLTQAITLGVFGWMPFPNGFLVELAIEPLPFGEHCLVHIDWTGSTGLDGFVHSWTYAHPDAIKHLQKWVGRRLNSN
jgi:pimeloyl-ACP methyl ester carboxylesterase